MAISGSIATECIMRMTTQIMPRDRRVMGMYSPHTIIVMQTSMAVEAYQGARTKNMS